VVAVSLKNGLRCEIATTLGAGGLFIQTDDPLPKGTQLAMRFQLPGGDRIHEIVGRVVWNKQPEANDGHASGMGIQFTDRYAAGQLARDLEFLD
jgi:uncharacterized protein (TIGR02266 family)